MAVSTKLNTIVFIGAYNQLSLDGKNCAMLRQIAEGQTFAMHGTHFDSHATTVAQPAVGLSKYWQQHQFHAESTTNTKQREGIDITKVSMQHAISAYGKPANLDLTLQLLNHLVHRHLLIQLTGSTTQAVHLWHNGVCTQWQHFFRRRQNNTLVQTDSQLSNVNCQQETTPQCCITSSDIYSTQKRVLI